MDVQYRTNSGLNVPPVSKVASLVVFSSPFMRLSIVSIVLLALFKGLRLVCLSILLSLSYLNFLLCLVLQERFSVSFAFRQALESALEGFRRQQDLVRSLQESFLSSVSRMKVSGEDAVLLLAAVSHSDPDFTLDYETFTLLASFFGWDSSFNMASSDNRRLSEWLHGSESSPAAAPPVVDPSTTILPEVGSSGLSAMEKASLPTSLVVSPSAAESSIASSRANSPAESAAIADGDPETENAEESDLEEEEGPGTVDSQVNKSRMCFSCFYLYFYLISYFFLEDPLLLFDED